jgi:type IV pilus assembly protein PilA
MAVLVGVLAPTLIGNIEKSRESKDLQNLDTIRQAAITAIANEAAYKEVVPSSGSVRTLTVSWSSGKATATDGTVTATGAFNEEFSSIVTSDPTMSSNAASAGDIQIVIDSTGAVTAQVVTSGTSNVVTTVKTKDSSNNVMSFQSK